MPALAMGPPFFLLGHLAYTDVRTRRLPNRMVASLALMAIVYVAIIPALSWRFALLGGLLGAGIPLAVNALGTLLGRKEGLGMGDVKLLGALGLLFGPNIVLVLGIACLIGAACALVRPQRTFAFGPYIALGAALVTLLTC